MVEEMNNKKFNSYEWHDVIIKNIIIDRNTPGINDSISIEISWPNKNKNNILLFEEVYWANLNMNFGIICSDSILNAYESNKNEKFLNDLFKKWKGLIDDVELNGYVINMNSTGSEIKIVAKRFKLLEAK